MKRITVQVPASTSNLGPGFDCLGMGLRLYNFVTLVRGEKRRPSPIIDETARKFFKESGVRPFPFSCGIAGDVPSSRGLGGSATVRLGVLHGLNRLMGNPLSKVSILKLAARLEGHPDNAAPSNFGGFTVVRGETVQRFEVSARLYCVLFVPDLEIKTSKARQVLPSKIGRMAAVESCANACAITAAFASRDYEKLRGAFNDHLHQPFRKKLIPFLPAVIAAAEKAGALGAFLSGSGSTVAALTMKNPKKVGAAMLRAAGSTIARVIVTTVDNHGVRLLSIGNRKSQIANRKLNVALD